MYVAEEKSYREDNEGIKGEGDFDLRGFGLIFFRRRK